VNYAERQYVNRSYKQAREGVLMSMNEETLDLSNLWQIIRKKLAIIIVVTILVTIIAGLYTYLLIEPQYRSTVSVFISDERSGTSVTETITDINMYQKLVETYAEIAKSRTVAEDVIKNLELDMEVEELHRMITTSPKGDTQFLNLSITSSDPEFSYNITNQIARSLKSVSVELRGTDVVQILDPANVPTEPYSPNVVMNMVIGFVLGLVLSVFTVFLLDFMDKTVKDPEFILNELQLPFLAAIPQTGED